MINLTPQVNLLADHVHELRGHKARILVALCGPPGSGKSTLAHELARRLNAQKCETGIVPMDGFHLDNEVLSQYGLLSRKGAPETFDSTGFVHLVQRLKERADIAIPVFDRSRDLSVAGAAIIPASAEVAIVEGNYLLYDVAPWRNLAPLWTLSVQLTVPTPELRSRLIHRWLSHGLSRAAATRRAEANDIPNAKAIMARALPADITLSPDSGS